LLFETYYQMLIMLHTKWALCVWQSDKLSIHSIKRYWKDVENGHGKSWKMHM